MIDWIFILILVLAIGLIVIQDQLIKRKDRLIAKYEGIMVRVEPILAAVVKAQEEYLKNKAPQHNWIMQETSNLQSVRSNRTGVTIIGATMINAIYIWFGTGADQDLYIRKYIDKDHFAEFPDYFIDSRSLDLPVNHLIAPATLGEWSDDC